MASIVAVAALATTPIVVVATSASAAAHELVVNSTAWGGADAVPGDGVCETGARNGVCTLRAAIEESNALNKPAGEVAITVAASIPVGTVMTGGDPNATQTLKMDSTTDVSVWDIYGAFFVVTAPVTIDLGHRLQPSGTASDTYEGAAFFLNGNDINLYNADNVLSSGSSVVAGPKANRVVVDGSHDGTRGKVSTTANYYPERFMVFREGAQNVTVKGYDVTGFYDSATEGGLFVFNAMTSPYPAMKNITVDDVDALYSSSTTCGPANGSGCRTRLTNVFGVSATDSSRISVEGLTFTNMTVQNMTGQYAFHFNGGDAADLGTYSASIRDLTITDNKFLRNDVYGYGEDYAFIGLPYGGKLTGTTTISRNVFTATQATDVAIYVNAQGPTPATASSTVASNITISDNYFDGYASGEGVVRSSRAGLLTFQRNTFGTKSGSQTTTQTEETATGVASMFQNLNNTSNQKIATWYPSAAASVLAGPTPAGALTASNAKLEPTTPVCLATVEVTRPTTAPVPGDPATLDLYWTSERTAELYLGSVSGVTGPKRVVQFPLPIGEVDLDLDGAKATAVNATTGAVSGNVRVQTQVEGFAQLQSSQYSRVVKLTGNCRPSVTINQATGQNESTTGRDLHFTVTSSLPLDTATLTPDDIGVTAVLAADTIDAARLNPRVVAVTEVPGSNGMAFDVVVRVDDSATVTATLAAERVATPAGLTNAAAAQSTDGSITFVNPLSVTPSRFTLVTGEPNGKDYTLVLKAGAPVPTADLRFASTVTMPDGAPAVTVSTDAPVIGAGESQSAAINVTAAAGDVAANTKATIAHTVTSDDANYDGLVVPSVTPSLFSTDPTIRIDKRAWVAASGTSFDTSAPEQIEATGTEAPKGTRLTDRQAVCFVYTVTNTSKDDWATSLTDVQVTDTDERLGTDGLIGTAAALGTGESVKFSACTALLPLDTTLSDVVPESGE